MAELVAQPFVSFLVERLGDLLNQEAKILPGVRGQVQQMQIELNRMQCFLKDADSRRQGGDEIVRNWVAEIRELSYNAEDVIATFVVKFSFERRGVIRHTCNRCLCIFKAGHVYSLHKVGSQIEAINTQITSLTRSLQTYGIQSITLGERQQQLRRSYSHVAEEDIVGFEKDVKTVVHNLVNGNTDCRVVSIWGMGGLGKTTLAKMVYKHSDVRRHFDCFAWAYISQHCKTREVLEGILMKLLSPSKEEREEIEKLKHDELAKKLYQVQSEKKCLVILDDIWDTEAWDSLSPGFPSTTVEVGSKILLTTRKREVPLYVDRQCFLHELRHLTEDESWELFQKKASPRRGDREFRLSTEMMVFGREMVRHCGGLPLAIVVLGGLLATKHKLDEWEMVRRNISYYLNKGKGQGGVLDVLALSYQDLPYHLKACFLCLSHLPDDEGIRPEKLVQMWMAEGIVRSSEPVQVGELEEVTLLDVGMSYLSELVQRCMVQVQLTRVTGRIKLCHLHDLMRDLCLSKAKEENFLKVVHLEDFASASCSSSSLTTIRRLAVYYLGDQGVDCARGGYGVPNHTHVRSCQFFFFGKNLERSYWQQIKFLLEGFKLLTLLDLERARLSSRTKILLPGSIGNLVHLRFLSIRDSRIRGLPSSIGNLGFLQTLDLRVTGPTSLRIPNVLWKLEQLRHLYLPFYIKGPWIGKLRLDGLSKLETLVGFDTQYFDVRCFPKLKNLRKVDVRVQDLIDLAMILKSPIFSNSYRLLRDSSFRIVADFRTEEEQNLLRQLLGNHHLQKLWVRGSLNLVKLPEQFCPNLTKLTLWDSGLEEDPMPTLEKLPNLRSLKLFRDSYIGKEMVCSAPIPIPIPIPTPTAPSNEIGGSSSSRSSSSCAAGGGGGFPQLRFLMLAGISSLEEWRVEEGAMPSLLRLLIGNCRLLKEIPDGLRFLTNLQELYIESVSEALLERLREGGEDFYKVQHVPMKSIALRRVQPEREGA